tara:strand:- start:15619 stop:16548 length:930 start_codon:yes stop_codon:yes gene_type:complete
LLTKIFIILNKKKLRVFFTDFWPNFKLDDNYFYNLLSQKYELEIDPEKPEILFHSVDYSGEEKHKKYNNGITKKIFFTGENILPNYNESHYSFSFNTDLNEKNYRLPLWVLFINWFNSEKDTERDPSYLIPLNFLQENKQKRTTRKPLFCSFIASKPVGQRMDFVPKLDNIKKVHSLGRLYSNSYIRINGRGDQKKKLDYMKLFKFNIAFENSISNGYVTEKILHSFYAKSLPIYWGDKKVKDDFNSDAFLFYNDFKNEESLITEIININNNKNTYLEYINQPIFKNNKVPDFCLPENVLSFLTEIIKK